MTTGTPQDVGFERAPPRFLDLDDVVQVESERVGAVANPIFAQVTW